MLVTTLPITLGENRPFFSLLTPLVAHLCGTALGARTVIMANTVGMKTDGAGLDREILIKSYETQLKGIGISKEMEIRHDGGGDYERHFRSVVESDHLREHIYEVQEEMYWCECGRVEIPRVSLESLIAQRRPKSLIRGDSLATVRCSKCSSLLAHGIERVLKLNACLAEPRCDPRIYEAEAESVRLRLSGRDQIITRNHRPDIGRFDTDFRWVPYLSWLLKREKRIVLVVGPTTLSQAHRVISLLKVTRPDVEVQLLVHPLVRTQDSQVSISGMSIEDFYNLEPVILHRRVFLSLGIQWGKAVTNLRSESLHLVRKSLGRLSGSKGFGLRLMSVDDFMDQFNQQAILAMLKCLRSGTEVDSPLFRGLVSFQS